MKRTLFLAIVACIVAVGALTANASAQATRTWVSGVGDDANPCSRTAPCKTFAGAIAKTAPGGEIDALDPGGFGALTITKSITLDGGGGQVASVLVAGTNGIVIAAGASDVVSIKNMRLDGLLGGGNGNAGLNGIRVISGGRVNLEHDDIFGFSQAGVDIEPGALTTVNVIDTVSHSNGVGMYVLGNGSLPRVSIDHSSFLNNGIGNATLGNGLTVNGNARVNVTNSILSQNQDGILSEGAGATVFLDATQVVNNTLNGLHATTSGAIDVAGSTIADNQGMGVLASGGAIGTFGTNILVRNAGGNGSFSGSDGTPQFRVHPILRPPF
ncbi:MAG: right-handed parallel beta-helix repeat-containing protein [Candidatus Eremiobacteraeota bacterium]|nr:right-handed parallel beta-helix repeat-containing protein [Candidatus Eremiobacteraeota bacterium]